MLKHYLLGVLLLALGCGRSGVKPESATPVATGWEYYRRLIAEYPTEQRVFLAKQQLRRMDDIEREMKPSAEK